MYTDNIQMVPISQILKSYVQTAFFSGYSYMMTVYQNET